MGSCIVRSLAQHVAGCLWCFVEWARHSVSAGFSSRAIVLCTALFMDKTFEHLRAFQRALDLMVEVYAATENFPRAELYGLTSQLRRASVSIVANIAEGQGRLTLGEWRQHLSAARGSLYELQAHLIAAQRLQFLEAAGAKQLAKPVHLTAVELQGLIFWVKRRELEAKNRSGQKPQTTSNQQQKT